MKKIILSILALFFIGITLAQDSLEKATPTYFIEKVVTGSNPPVRVNGVSEITGGSVSKTLSEITGSSIATEYINWIGFFALSIAVILIIYNGVLLITSRGNDGVMKKAQARITNIIIGILVIFGGYVIIQLVLSLIKTLFS